MDENKEVRRHYKIKVKHDIHLHQEAYKRRMNMSEYLQMLIDDDMVGIERESH